MNRHLSLLGLLHLVIGCFGMVAALIVFVALVGGGIFSGEAGAFLVTTTLGTVLGVFLAALSLPSLIAAFGLMGRKEWARPLTLVVSVFHLFNIPFGTALAIYSFWVLTRPEAVEMLRSTG
jgi:hypothetical protein